MASLSVDAGTFVALGLPPSDHVHVEPLSVVSSLAIMAFLVAAAWCYVRVLAWLDVKLCSRKLLHEVYRELRAGGPPRR